MWDSMRLVESTTATPPLKSYLRDSSGRGLLDSLNSTTTSEESHLYKIAHGYSDSQYLTVREYRSKTSKNTLTIDLVATFCNTASYTSTLGTVTIYNFYWVPVYIPSYSTTSYSDCIDAGYDKCHFFSSSQTTLSDWHKDSWMSNFILTDSNASAYNDYIMGVYVYLKWKSSNKNERYMFLHCDELGSAII